MECTQNFEDVRKLLITDTTPTDKLEDQYDGINNSEQRMKSYFEDKLEDQYDGINNSEQRMKSYFEEQSEHQNDLQLDKHNKKQKGYSHRVEPITDTNKITQLFSKNGRSASFFTRVGCKPKSNTEIMMVVPYCTPTMYYVCHKCGMADQNGSKIELHVKNDPHYDNKKIKKGSCYTPSHQKYTHDSDGIKVRDTW
jgi:hypothetical protein